MAIVKAAGQAFKDDCQKFGKYKNSLLVYWC